jgi:hypothetical protein
MPINSIMDSMNLAHSHLANQPGHQPGPTPDSAPLAAACSRRAILRASLVLGAGALLTACKAKNSTTAWKPLNQDELNGPPHIETHAASTQRYTGGTDSAPLPNVIPRRAWTTAQPAMAYINPMNGIERITVHHAGFVIASRNQDEIARVMEAMRRDHTTNRKDATGRPWADIGYHYLIDPAGRVWEGRPIRFQGAHVSQNNEHNLGIQVMGNFDEQKPTPEQIRTLDAFVADRMRAYRVPVARVYTHQEIKPTACPGRNLQAYMERTRSSGGRMASA